MRRAQAITKRTLYNGGELCVNRMGETWTVDVWGLDNSDGEPDYHAAYDSESAALNDAESWRQWEGK